MKNNKHKAIALSLILSFMMFGFIRDSRSKEMVRLDTHFSFPVLSQSQGDFLIAPTPTTPNNSIINKLGSIPSTMYLPHLNGKQIYNNAVLQALPSTWDWRAQKKVTSAKNQGSCGSCFAHAGIANAESKFLLLGEPSFDFSENNAKECIWEEINSVYIGGSPVGSCDGGNSYMLANLFSKKGVTSEECDAYQPSDVGCNTGCPYLKTLIDYRIISHGVMPDPEVLKQYVYTYGPVEASLYVDTNVQDWGNYNGSYTIDYLTPLEYLVNHDVLIVGWSDNLPPLKGKRTPASGWIVKNSWGAGWGDHGFFYITFGSANMGLYSSIFNGWKEFDPDDLLYYQDDAAWSGNSGYFDIEAWRLVKFKPSQDTVATQVEFWTNDQTQDVDIYIYDDFDGYQPSNLLWQSLNKSFAEAGYHSVVIDPPMRLTSGNDVFVVIKITNTEYPYPIAVDIIGSPANPPSNYTSHYGTSGTWVSSEYDAIIRLRTNSKINLYPDLEIKKSYFPLDVSPGDQITFSLDIRNIGNDTSWNPIITDIIPPEITPLDVQSTLTLSAIGSTPYTWEIPSLGVNKGGTITITGLISPLLSEDFSIINAATIYDPKDITPGNNMSKVILGGSKVYLPDILREIP